MATPMPWKSLPRFERRIWSRRLHVKGVKGVTKRIGIPRLAGLCNGRLSYMARSVGFSISDFGIERENVINSCLLNVCVGAGSRLIRH
jgi:hypothetical protein